MLKRMLIPAMLQEIRSGNGDDDGPTTLRFCKGCVAATVTTRRPCYGVERLFGCTKAVAPALAIRQRAMTNTKTVASRKFATCRRKFAACHRFATRLRKFATSVTKLQHAVTNLQHAVTKLQQAVAK